MATTLSTGELPRHLEEAPTPTATAQAKHWAAEHRTLLLVLAAVWVLSLLVAFELGHWVEAGMPPPREHLAELLDHMTGLTEKWMWIRL